MIDTNKTRNKKILTEKLEIETTDLPSTITILSEEEIEKLYKATEETLEGYRLRAILALYYGLGLRRTEGYNLEQEDIDYRRNLIHIKRSKTHTNRYIPMSIRVKKDLKSYQTNVRPHLITTTTQKLLLNKRGTPMQKGIALNQIKHLGKKAGIEKTITLHMLRHSIATHLLKRGMKLEQITQFLGHKSIESTQIYTHIQNGV
jgi:integrase/recombinase XerD